MFRKLNADEIEVRVAQVGAKGCQVLLYKTSRVDMAILDEVFGCLNWTCDYKEIKGRMYCGIGIRENASEPFVWKWDCGTESNMEAEKGEASDSFKRAGFKVGIGRELYTAPFIWLNVPTEQQNGKWKLKDAFEKFSVNNIQYDENGKIVALVIEGSKSGIVYTFGKYKAPAQTKAVVKEQTFSEKEINGCLDYLVQQKDKTVADNTIKKSLLIAKFLEKNGRTEEAQAITKLVELKKK